MKNRTIILSEEQLTDIIHDLDSCNEGEGCRNPKAFNVLAEALEGSQDINYQAMVRYHAYLEWGKEAAGLIPEFDVGTFPGEHIVEFGKIMSLGLRNLDFEMDEETEYDLSRWANECLVAGLCRINDGQDWEPEYRKYELVKARGAYKKADD